MQALAAGPSRLDVTCKRSRTPVQRASYTRPALARQQRGRQQTVRSTGTKEYENELEPGRREARRVSISPGRLDRIARDMRSSSLCSDPCMPEHAAEDSPLLRSMEELNDSIKGTALGRRWDAIPARYKIVFGTSLAFVICNMDKVNISVAIIPMAQDFGWSPTISGLVQSSFFWGYILSQIPGGYVASRFGGRKLLPAGVSLWSAATAAVPVLAGTIPGLFVSRAAVGLGEGVAPSAATDMVARVVEPSERARAISFIFGGLHVGSLLGLLVAPSLIEHYGWQTVFYLFGVAGMAWSLWFEWLVGSVAATEPEVAEKLIGGGDSVGADGKQIPVPWRAFLRHGPVRALAYTHFCNNWFHYSMMAWLPSYFADTMSLSLSQAAQLSLLPPVAAIAASAIAGPSADALIERGWDAGTVRKLAQCTAFLGPATCLTAACFTDNSTLSVGLITSSLGLASFSLAGLYCNHADLSPRYAPVLLGLTNTSGAVPGIVGVAVTGAILDQTGSWQMALFAPSVFFFLTGAAVFTAFGSSTRTEFTDNTPFGFEKYFEGTGRAFGRVQQALALPAGKLQSAQQRLSAAASKAVRVLQGKSKGQ